MKKLLYLLYVLLILIVLFPKEELYYTLESKLAEENIYFSNEKLENAGFYLDINAIDVVLDNLSIGSIEQITIAPWIIANRVTIRAFKVSPDYQLFFPGKVDEVILSYSLWDPLKVNIEASGDFGVCRGNFDLIDQRLRVVFDATPQLGRYPLMVSKLHKEGEGLVYESNF
jgi:hypothetical protein